jgi:hypothetical protein
MMRVRLLRDTPRAPAGEVLELPTPTARELLAAGVAEVDEETEGEAGETVGPILETDASFCDAHEVEAETMTARSRETSSRRPARTRR